MRHFPIKYITELADIAGRYRPGGNFYSTPSVKQASTHMQQIRQYFEKLVTMTDTDWDLFSSGLERQEFAKK